MQPPVELCYKISNLYMTEHNGCPRQLTILQSHIAHLEGLNLVRNEV